MKVELIYDADCPNVAETRANLLQAFAAAYLEAEWTEWERSSPSIPAYAARFGSPTVLVEGRDVAGESPKEHISSCRLYASAEGRYSGAPSVELLRTSFGSGNSHRLSELLEAELPRCPWHCAERSSRRDLPGVLASLRGSTFSSGAQLPALLGVPAPAYRSIPAGFGFYTRISSEGATGLRPFCTWPCCRDAHPLGQIFDGVKRPGLRGRGASD